MSKLKHKSENKILKTIRIIKNVIFAVILVVLVGVITLTLFTRISGKTPSIMGYAVYRVSSGSMVPTFNIGDVILCRECDPMELKEGDIITYEGTTGEFAGKNVTHRVIKEPYKDGDNYFLVTKGDDNPVEDSPISISQVTGKFLQKINLLTSLYEFFITPWGLLSLIFLIILAFFNEIVVFIRAVLGIGYADEGKESIQDIIDRYSKTAPEADNTEAERLAEKEQEISDKAEILAIEEKKHTQKPGEEQKEESNQEERPDEAEESSDIGKDSSEDNEKSGSDGENHSETEGTPKQENNE